MIIIIPIDSKEETQQKKINSKQATAKNPVEEEAENAHGKRYTQETKQYINNTQRKEVVLNNKAILGLYLLKGNSKE